jgi:hypothetical protein
MNKNQWPGQKNSTEFICMQNYFETIFSSFCILWPETRKEQQNSFQWTESSYFLEMPTHCKIAYLLFNDFKSAVQIIYRY